jgi:hypothetical protein
MWMKRSEPWAFALVPKLCILFFKEVIGGFRVSHGP